MKFYNIQRNWKKLRPYFEQSETRELAHCEMEAYSMARAEDYGYQYKPRELTPAWKPSDYVSCDWRCDTGRRGPDPAFWDWVCHSACHWVNNVGMLVAVKALPKYDWQVVSSNLHTTVVDFKRETLFDLNFLALGISPEKTIELALNQQDTEIYAPGVLPFY